jgi:hypothetical protein
VADDERCQLCHVVFSVEYRRESRPRQRESDPGNRMATPVPRPPDLRSLPKYLPIHWLQIVTRAPPADIGLSGRQFRRSADGFVARTLASRHIREPREISRGFPRLPDNSCRSYLPRTTRRTSRTIVKPGSGRDGWRAPRQKAVGSLDVT